MIQEETQHIAVLSVSLHIPAAQSLKDKRTVLKSLKDRVHKKFNVSIAELGGQDKWQVTTLGFAMIGNDNRHMDASLQNLLSFIEKQHGCELCEHQIEFY